MSRPKTLLNALLASFDASLRVADGEARPAALLWTDADGQWLPLMPRLRMVLPQLFTLGSYDTTARTGPAIWLRCIVDRTIRDVSPPEGVVPVLYLPGVQRQELREAGLCRLDWQPLVELQYRGRVWHHRNARDWTVEGFVTSEDGLGLAMAGDARTHEALRAALPLLADAPLDGLTGRHLDADDFNHLAVPDPVRDVLRWMADPAGFRKAAAEPAWRAFCSLCRSSFELDPDRAHPGDAANALFEGRGRWTEVWERFCDAPKLHPGVVQLLRESPAPMLAPAGRQPRRNDEAEAKLRKALEQVAALPHHDALSRVGALEQEHAPRRAWVWAQVGESPLALALAPLAELAVRARTPIAGQSLQGLISAYACDGWRCDRAALEALRVPTTPADQALVHRVVAALYGPWLDASARQFQDAVAREEAAARTLVGGTTAERDVCVVFADGLRFDLAAMLSERLAARGWRTKLTARLAPVPSVTATAKPLATPIGDAITARKAASDFEPLVARVAQPATAQRLRDEMELRGIDCLAPDEARAARSGFTSAWTENGHVDELGHKLGARLAGQLDLELEALVERVRALFDCGWLRIRIVTDHGWLLLPGGLPRVDLPKHLASTRWARCAEVRDEAEPSVPLYGWHWNAGVRIASPPGSGVFMECEYAHGGVSPQECIAPELVVERGETTTQASITNVKWRGLRCRVTAQTTDPAVRVDLREHWKQPATSIVAAPKEVGPTGEANLVVPDDLLEGRSATVVLVDVAGNVLDRRPTTVGET